jgi:hypothetical protein
MFMNDNGCQFKQGADQTAPLLRYEDIFQSENSSQLEQTYVHKDFGVEKEIKQD